MYAFLHSCRHLVNTVVVWYDIGITNIKLGEMTVVNKVVLPDEENRDWENPGNPEKAADNRDVEQILRQKHEAERRHNNLSDTPENEEAKNADKRPE